MIEKASSLDGAPYELGRCRRGELQSRAGESRLCRFRVRIRPVITHSYSNAASAA